MDLAYIISAYRYAHQLVRLVDRLDEDGTSFFIHVDRRTDQPTMQAMLDGLDQRPNVSFLPRHRSDWGGFGHVAATLKGIDAIEERAIDCEWAILLTGQDYPIKPNPYIADFLARSAGRLFMEYFALPAAEWTNGGLDRYESWHLRIAGRHLVVNPQRLLGRPRRMPRQLQPYGGSSYWCLPRASVTYVRAFIRQHPSVLRFFRYVNVPDEMFFQTVLLNSPFREHVVNDNLRHIEWRDPESGSPTVLRLADLAALAASPALFARKFDMTVDAEVLDAIDQTLLGLREGEGRP